MKRIYLDWNATAPMLPSVRTAVSGAMEGVFGNASSVHQEGQAARTQVERTRRAVAKALNGPAQSVILTSGATESNNLVIRDFARRNPEATLHFSAVEHPSVVEVAGELQASGYAVNRITVDASGQLDLAFLEHVGPGDLVSVMWANNEMGNIYPIAQIAAEVHVCQALLHVDATQALGRVPVDFGAVEADFMSLSFHKMGGPKGIGALLIREGRKVEAILAGGHQERGRRPGTENVPAAAGLETAMHELTAHGAVWTERLSASHALMMSRLTKIKGLTLRGNARGPQALPNTLNFAVEGVDGENLLLALDLDGVALSSGSACTAGSLEPSHVILAMGFEPKKARESVRISFGPSTTQEELLDAADRIERTVDRLRRI